MALSQQALNGYIAAIGAAGGIGAFVLLMDGKARKIAIASSLIVLIIALGAVSWLESEVNPA